MTKLNCKKTFKYVFASKNKFVKINSRPTINQQIMVTFVLKVALVFVILKPVKNM